MAVFAVVNRKGGTGKSLLATHLAAYLASLGHEVMLGDVDRQHSSRLWLGLRPTELPRIQGWTIDERNFARPPAGVKHVVLDTPAGFQGIGLMKVALWADAILIPATPSLFDRKPAAACLEELRTFPRVATGKCRVACIGSRIDTRTRDAELLRAWAVDNHVPCLGEIKERQIYPRRLEQGLTVFDGPSAKLGPCLEDWRPILSWIDEVLMAESSAPAMMPTVRPVPQVPRPRFPPVARRPIEAKAPGEARFPNATPAMARTEASATPAPASASANEPDEAIPGFLRKLITRVF